MSIEAFVSWVPDIVVAIIVASAVLGSIRMCMQYERAVIFRFGRYVRTSGPGLFFKMPWIERAVLVSIQIETKEIAHQEMITKDNLSLVISAVVFYQVKIPANALIQVSDYNSAIDQYALTTLRNVVGSCTMSEVLSDHDKVTKLAKTRLEEVVEEWGVEARRVEIKQVELPEELKRAMAREAEAIREKNARIIKAEGEKLAAVQLKEAADLIASTPSALELRRLQTMAEIGAENNSTVIVAMPMEIIQAAKMIGTMR